MLPSSPHSPVPPLLAVELRHASKLYGSFAALREVTLALPAGTSAVLLGPNGAGKSTLLKLLAGLTSPTYGEVLCFGQRPGSQRGRIATLGHQTMLYDELSAQENLQYTLRLYLPNLAAAEARQRIRRALDEVALDPDNPRRLGEYSQGMRQRTSLARVLLGQPDLLLLDEPFSNLDVTSVAAMVERLRHFLAEASPTGTRRTLLVTTHQAELARPLAQLTLTMEAGKLVTESSKCLPSDLTSSLAGVPTP